VGLVGEAVEEFDFAFGEFFADGDAKGDADQVGVFEFDAGALVAVIEEDVESGGFEDEGDLLSGGEEFGLADVGDGDDDLEGGYGRGQRIRL
jgi:hypothetical protein